MENIKVRVSNKAESKEVQEFFDSLGLLNRSWSGFKLPKLISNHIFGEYSDYLLTDAGINHYKELTITQLRDLVVLKRNSINDATHINLVTGSKVLQQGDKNYYWQNGVWHLYPCGVDIKPIEKKEMKEFLVNHDDKWTLQLLDADTEENSYRVAVPCWADTATRDSSDIIYFWKNVSNETYVDGEGWKLCDDKEYTFLNTYIQHDDAVIVWQRHTQPEELPFVDDEPINNPSHYTSGNIECLDAMQAMLSSDEFIGFLRGNIFKYQWRYKLKNGVEDLKKAQFYQNKLIELESKG